MRSAPINKLPINKMFRKAYLFEQRLSPINKPNWSSLLIGTEIGAGALFECDASELNLASKTPARALRARRLARKILLIFDFFWLEVRCIFWCFRCTLPHDGAYSCGAISFL